jgi:hypothetical protein
MYWSSEEDTSIPIVPTVMPWNCFRKIKNNFHLIDNNEFLKKDDKLGKVAPIYEELCKSL